MIAPTLWHGSGVQPRAGGVPQPTVSVVLCVRNGAATLDRQLDALAAQDVDGAWEIVLVDNGSTDGTNALATARTAQMPRLRLVREARPGLNRARNRGVRAAAADRLLCCDADDEVGRTWVREMVSALDHFDIVGGALEPHPHVRAGGGWFECPQTSALPTLFGEAYAVGASLGFTRRVFEAMDGFDESFGMGADEVDFCLRARRAGFSIGFVPRAVARYGVKETTAALMRQRFNYGRGYQRLLAKYDCAGWIDSPRRDRWRALAKTAGSLVWTSPRAFRPDERREYLARLSHVAGEATELARPGPTTVLPIMRPSPGG